MKKSQYTNETIIQYYFKPKEYIPLHQNILWQIDRGVVQTLTWSEDGDRILLGFWSEGDIIGNPITSIKPYEIQCITTVTVLMLHCDLWHQTYNSMMSQLKRSEELLGILKCKSIRLRLRQFLAWLSARFGSALEHGVLINLRLTHQDIADAINSTRVSVTRLLNEFKNEGLISLHSKHFLVVNNETN